MPQLRTTLLVWVTTRTIGATSHHVKIVNGIPWKSLAKVCWTPRQAALIGEADGQSGHDGDPQVGGGA